MLLHIDGSRHRWFQDERWYDLIVILDDASSEIYYAQLVEEESTATVMAGLREVIERQGLFCALYSDRGSHFWLTPKAGGKVDPHRPDASGTSAARAGSADDPGLLAAGAGTQRAQLRDLAGTAAAGAAVARDHDRGRGQPVSAGGLHRRVQPSAFRWRRRSAAARFVPCPRGKDLDRIFCLQFERTVNRDNTVSFQNLQLQIERVQWRGTLAGCTVTVHQHLDGTISLTHGPHRLGRYSAQGVALTSTQNAAAETLWKRRAVEKSKNRLFPRAWKSRQLRGIPTFPQPRRRLYEST